MLGFIHAAFGGKYLLILVRIANNGATRFGAGRSLGGEQFRGGDRPKVLRVNLFVGFVYLGSIRFCN